jgi:ubiquinone/menaquinone biosynthesis C-methylase UbiE
MEVSPKFWDKIAPRYSKQPIADEASYQKKLEKSQTYFRPNMEVLEFGCGTGGTAIIHAPYVKHIQAIDISPRMIEIANGKAEAANVDNVDFEDLVNDRDAVLKKVFRLLKPGGIFISSTVCMLDLASLIRFVVPIMQFFGQAPFVSYFTGEELLDSIRSAGFEIDYDWRPGKKKAVFIVAKKPR